MPAALLLLALVGAASAAFDASSGYGKDMCLSSHQDCALTTESMCPSNSKVPLCDKAIEAQPAFFKIATRMYEWSRNSTTAAMTVAAIPGDLDWNQFEKLGKEEAGTCGKPGTCDNAYTKVVLVFDEENCWPRSKAIPVLGNADSPDAQMKVCANSVKHLLGKKPLGAFVLSPTEQLDFNLLRKPVVTCGNTINKKQATDDAPLEKDPTKSQPPFLLGEEGGGGVWGFPWTYAEREGICYEGNGNLSETYRKGGTRFGGTVSTEEYGHTFFSTGIPQFDPEGWKAAAKAEIISNAKFLANKDDLGGHERDDVWTCHAAATEYFAAGVEMLLYNVRIGENHKSTTRTELRDNDPNLWCLAARYHEINNKYSPCSKGPALKDVAQTVDCKATLRALGVKTFGPDGTGGTKGGGAKVDGSRIVDSTANCKNTGTTCASYKGDKKSKKDTKKTAVKKKKENKACFPASATAERSDGTHVRMDEIRVGNRVRVAAGAHDEAFSEVFIFTHADPAYSSGDFVRVSAGGRVLTASRGHFVYKAGEVSGEKAAVVVESLRVGDMMVVDGAIVVIEKVESVEGKGLYNPQTLHGDIVVDGFLSMTYTRAIMPQVAHALLAPARAAYLTGGLDLSAVFEVCASYVR